MRSLFLSVILFFSINSFCQTTYFVDATNGDDSNSGTTGSSAWQTISKVNDQTFSAGDIILFKRGETWTGEQLEIQGSSGTYPNLITFGAYPQTGGAKPIISTITNHSHTWINEGNNIWKATNPPNYHPERLFVDGIEILRANSFDELDGINFFWLYDADEFGDLYIYSETEPSSLLLSYTENIVAVYLEDANYIVFTNLDLQGSWASVFINSNTSYIHFNEMEIGKYASGGININSENSSTPNHIHIKNSNFDSFFTLDYSMSENYQGQFRGVSDAIFLQCGEYCEIENNYFKNWGHASINIDGNPFGGDDVKVEYISVYENYMTSPDICYGGRIAIDDAHHCEVFNNEIINTSVQSQFNGYNNHFHHNIIDGTTNPPMVDNDEEISAGISIEAYSNTETYNNIIENNLIKNIEGVGIQIVTSGNNDIHNNIIRNNIIYNCGTVLDVEGIGIWIHLNEVDCESFNNSFYNNLIFNATTTNTINFRGTITDIDGFHDFHGTSQYQIADNIAGNPLFVDVNTADYHLSQNSPCVNTGTNTLATLDFEGNTIPCDGTNTDIAGNK